MKTRQLRSWTFFTPPLAARVGTRGRGVNHFGLFIGRFGRIARAVAHNKKGQHVVVEPIEVFAPDGIYWVERRTPAGHQSAAIARMLYLATLRRPYSLWTHNCEHATSWAQTGVRSSPQLDGMVKVALVFGTIALVARTASDDD